MSAQQQDQHQTEIKPPLVPNENQPHQNNCWKVNLWTFKVNCIETCRRWQPLLPSYTGRGELLRSQFDGDHLKTFVANCMNNAAPMRSNNKQITMWLDNTACSNNKESKKIFNIRIDNNTTPMWGKSIPKWRWWFHDDRAETRWTKRQIVNY